LSVGGVDEEIKICLQWLIDVHCAAVGCTLLSRGDKITRDPKSRESKSRRNKISPETKSRSHKISQAKISQDENLARKKSRSYRITQYQKSRRTIIAQESRKNLAICKMKVRYEKNVLEEKKVAIETNRLHS
jgi:hypothetical protein